MDKAQMTQEIEEVLAGYAKANPTDLARLGEYNNWKELARWEETRRAAHLLKLFDDQALASIASGEIDLQALCLQAAAAQKDDR